MKIKDSFRTSVVFLIILSGLNCNKTKEVTSPEIKITEDEHFYIVSKEIGPNGGTVDFGDGTTLSIPKDALTSEVEISILKIKDAPPFSVYGTETFRLEPSGIKFDKPIILQTTYEEYLDYDEDLIAAIIYSQDLGKWERLNIVEQDQS